MYDALYARQSVERIDSISIESQLEYCRFETHGNDYKEYIDKGYSGKNTNRPAFENMLKDIKQGVISRVIVYKLDRISRSILDFSNMMDIFQKYNVEFVSSTEHFDTSTPIGRAMLNICIVFAQLERETIQKRVRDAYYSRCKKGLYMGGRIPYGFGKADTVIDGIKTSMYKPVQGEVEQIKLMFTMYADYKNSLGDIIKYFNENNIKHLRGGMWTTSRISEILRNTIYVKADIDVYNFLKSQGVNVVNSLTDFVGYNACYMYDIMRKEAVLAPHEGIISSQLWLKCRQRCLNNRQSTRTCKAKNSWLLGKVKCGRCKYGLTVVKSNTKWHRYFVCATSLSTKKSKCIGTGGTIYADVLEEYVYNAISIQLEKFEFISAYEENNKTRETKMQLSKIDNEIENLLYKVSGANDTLMNYINDKIDILNAEKNKLEIEPLYNTNNKIYNINEKWSKMIFEDRQAVADILIKVITIADDKIEITWNI